MMKFLYKLTILGAAGIFLSGCSLFPTAWRSSRPASPAGRGEPAVTAGPTQTVEELDEEVSADLETELDADLEQIEAELKAIDEEAKSY